MIASRGPCCFYADEVEEVQTCAICHGALRHGFQRRLVMPKRLPCGHVFHLGCLRRWMIHSLGKEASCPMCRLQLPNALEAGTADCWQTKALAGIRWWLDWPKQHAVSVRTPRSSLLATAQLPASPPSPCSRARSYTLLLHMWRAVSCPWTISQITPEDCSPHGCPERCQCARPRIFADAVMVKPEFSPSGSWFNMSDVGVNGRWLCQQNSIGAV